MASNDVASKDVASKAMASNAVKNEDPQTADTVAEKETPVFSKAKILSMKKFSHRRDLLSVLLEDGKTYTAAEVDRIIDGFMKGVAK